MTEKKKTERLTAYVLLIVFLIIVFIIVSFFYLTQICEMRTIDCRTVYNPLTKENGFCKPPEYEGMPEICIEIIKCERNTDDATCCQSTLGE